MAVRTSQTFTISLPAELAEEVDRLAREEHRNRSELFREALRRYLNSQQRWNRVFEFGPRMAEAAGLKDEADVDAAVDAAVRDVRSRRRHQEE